MADPSPRSGLSTEQAFARQVEIKAARKLQAQREAPGVWLGLGVSGLIGWSVAVPTLLGALVGAWWDRHHPGAHSWTLMLLVAGLLVGCANAWHWLLRQDRTRSDEPEGRDE